MDIVLSPGDEFTICPGDLQSCVRIVAGHATARRPSGDDDAGRGERIKVHDVVAGIMAGLPDDQPLVLQPIATRDAHLLVRVDPESAAHSETIALPPAFAEVAADRRTRFAAALDGDEVVEVLRRQVQPLLMRDGALAIVWDSGSGVAVLDQIAAGFDAVRVFTVSDVQRG
jgi:hypothetical protein